MISKNECILFAVLVFLLVLSLGVMLFASYMQGLNDATVVEAMIKILENCKK